MASSRGSPIHHPIHHPIHLPPSDLQFRPSTRFPSPTRPAPVPDYQSIDPLLKNLSPESTLEALSSTNAVPKNSKAAHDILSKSISQVSPAERALGIRAAVAAQNLSQWYKEIQSWEWPKRTDAHLGKGFVPPSAASTDQEHCGSLPAVVVADNEKRIEEIRDGLENLGVDELKEHVLNAHIPARSRPSSSNSTMSVPPPLSYVQLSDFTAVITATILRALPLLSRLNSLLSTWEVRLLVLRQIPGLLHSLHTARSDLDVALGLLKSTETPHENDPLYSMTNYHIKRSALEATVVAAGRRMDRILDALESREDSLPEAWIDDLETIESQFGSWVMDAEKRTVQNEWRRMMTSSKEGKVPEPVQIEVCTPSEESTDGMEQASKTSISTSPQVICEIGRPHPMETIHEEPASPCDLTPTTTINLSQIPTLSPIVDAPFPEMPISILSEEAEPVPPLDKVLCEQPHNKPTLNDICPLPAVIANEEQINTTSDQVSLSNGENGDIQESVNVDAESENGSSVLEEPGSFSNLPDEKEALHCDDWPRDNINIENEPNNVGELTSLKGSPAEIVEEKPQLDELPCPSESTDERLINFSEAKAEGFPSQQPHDAIEELKYELSETCDDDLPQRSNICEVIDQHEPTQAQSTPAVGHMPPPLEKLAVAMDVVLDEAIAPISDNQGDSVTSHSSIPSLDTSGSSDKEEGSVVHLSNPPHPEETAGLQPVKKPLDSPIRLSKGRSEHVHLENHNASSRDRQSSNASAASVSDYPSLVSSPGLPEPLANFSDNKPLPLETPPQFRPKYQPTDPMPSSHDHALREGRLLDLDDNVTPPRTALKHNRTLSLPLQRFINERLDMDYESHGSAEMDSPTTVKTPKDEPNGFSPRPPKKDNRLSAPPNSIRLPKQEELESSREGSPFFDSEVEDERLNGWKRNRQADAKKSRDVSPLQPPIHMAASRLRKQLIAHPSLEDIGGHKSKPPFVDEAPSVSTSKKPVRPSLQGNKLRKPRDQMDEKINSILTSLPANISLMPAEDQEFDTESVTSLPLKARELRSASRLGTSSRSSTPSAPFTMIPAPSRRRHSHAPGANEMKVYHLHGGNKAPVKLACRPVGKNGERVMARIGGGWSDLAEYLTVYAMHHGSRHVSETPLVEVQGLSSRESTPSYVSPGTRVASAGNGRTTPSRPQSVMSNRAPSSLAVRKTRRASNASEAAGLRAVSAGAALNASYSPMSTVSSRRRLSVSSNTSIGGVSSVNCSPSTTIGGPTSHTVPLGLAGPKPRSRRISMTPESEAWVEDVLGQARRSTSLRPLPSVIAPQDQENTGRKTPSLAKSRSINDIGKAGSSQRVVLRGLGSRLN
ncbi:hypothetical protein FE257_004178 [Aspergillus nanangensis]|uniref:GAR domain-containing protein n=1 Tax=Aspergillus nanangensis TaxID=2582783 RepID=A0AAD4CRY3_ASPNN|nr:hypothetical protein FE257_004178 [Aspergillus nanangensis]